MSRRPEARVGAFLLAVGLLAGTVLVGTVLASAGHADEPLQVTITRPKPGQPIFGDVELAAEVWPADKVEVVEFFVDGRFAGRVTAPPYRVRFDVGRQNAEHRIEVVARGTGAPGEALLVTPGFRVDDETELTLQQLYVTVTEDGERVTDIGRSAFTVLDEGQAQELVTFERGDVPLTAVLLLDASSSMRGDRLVAALAGARTFIEGMARLDLAKLLLFSDRVLHSTPFTGFDEVLTAGLGGVEAVGGTALNDHLYMALKLLEERQGRRVVILLSDGADVTSALAMRDVLWVARRSQALVYWICLGRPLRSSGFRTAWRDTRQSRREQELLEEVIIQSGGHIEVIGTVAETGDAFARILADLRGQYVLGYYPSARRRDGSWHDVAVLVGRPEAEVRTREGYLDD